MTIQCTQCKDGEMEDDTIGGTSISGVITVLFLSILTIILFFVFWPLAILIIVASVFMPSEKKKHIKVCDNCGHFYEVIK